MIKLEYTSTTNADKKVIFILNETLPINDFLQEVVTFLKAADYPIFSPCARLILEDENEYEIESENGE